MLERHRYFLEHHFHIQWNPAHVSSSMELVKLIQLNEAKDHLKNLHILAAFGYLFIVKSVFFECDISHFKIVLSECQPYLSYQGPEGSFDPRKLVTFLDYLLHESSLTTEDIIVIWGIWTADLQGVIDHIRTDHPGLLPLVNELLSNLKASDSHFSGLH